ncbi:hypothetical protein OEZ86_002671 [Tetradesmus obliquus]|nr:hypothetical protein OEZ86_002671 [Tetradesmus obliquus]
MDRDSALQAAHYSTVQQTQQLIDELEDMALDPTLDQCCRRDIQSQMAKERIRQSLQREDRIDARQRLAAEAVCRDPAALAAASLQETLQQQRAAAAAFKNRNDELDSDLEAEGEGDAELAALRQQRLAQLRAQGAAQQQAQRSGFGSLNDVQEGQLLPLLREPPGRGVLVVHLAVQGFEPCNTLDECLAAAAAQYRGTYFARVVVQRGSALVARLQLPQGVPALLVALQGLVLGKAHISQFGAHDIWEEEVMAYLRRFKALSTGDAQQRPARPGASSAAAASDDENGSSDEEDTQADGRDAPCEVCGRTYAHTHVRALYSTQQQGSDADDEVRPPPNYMAAG